jgi:hypothetical protein
MTIDRYSFMDEYKNKIKIYSNRLYKEYMQKKTEYNNLRNNYKDFLANYSKITGLKWQNTEVKAQIKNYENEKTELEIVLNNVKAELDTYEKEYLHYYNLENSTTFEGYNSKGFLDRNFIDKLLDGSESTGFVLQGMQYRPDKVSMYYYQTPFLHWIITLVNGFFGVQDYTEGTEIKLPSIRTINNMLQ